VWGFGIGGGKEDKKKRENWISLLYGLLGEYVRTIRRLNTWHGGKKWGDNIVNTSDNRRRKKSRWGKKNGECWGSE